MCESNLHLLTEHPELAHVLVILTSELSHHDVGAEG